MDKGKENLNLTNFKKDLNTENLKIIKDILNKINLTIGKKLLSWLFRYPRYLKNFFYLYQAYINAQQTREKELKSGLQVPPTLILSITPHCNLKCEGCYAQAAGNIEPYKEEKNKIHTKNILNQEKWYKIIEESRELGVFCNIIAGGEPFLFPGLIELCNNFKDRTFVIFTNGTALTPTDYELLKYTTNLAIIVSIEGSPKITNQRRGSKVYEKAFDTIKNLNKIGVPTGISTTITSINYKYWMDPKNIDDLIAQDIRIIFLLEYIPPSPLNTLLLTPEQRREFRAQILEFRKIKPIFIIHSPGDEEKYGGCISAGRGFAHINAQGDLTPCPVSNIATHNLTNFSLRQGLASPLFKEICKNEHLLETEGMPCALFAHPDEVSNLAQLVGAYKTNLNLKE
jgi:MoaA/NifB/PqqE/SkfB family radical SAM enzyme